MSEYPRSFYSQMTQAEVFGALGVLDMLSTLVQRDERVRTVYEIERHAVLTNRAILSGNMPLHQLLRERGRNHSWYEPLLSAVLPPEEMGLFAMTAREYLTHKQGIRVGDEEARVVKSHGLYVYYRPYDVFTLRMSTLVPRIVYSLDIQAPLGKHAWYEESLVTQTGLDLG